MKKNKPIICIISWLILLSFCLQLTPFAFAAGSDSKQIEKYIEAAFAARKKHDGLTGNSILGSDKFTSTEGGGSNAASSTWSDWLAFAMGRYCIKYDDGRIDFKYNDNGGYQKYLSAMKSYVTKTYAENDGFLSSSKSTEWQRAALTVAALGGDPENFGVYNGKPINLISDGCYNCVIKNGPARQGINGVIFALIAENSGDYNIPKSVKYSEEYLITYILKQQLPDGENGSFGGWALSGNVSDPDITAMALQALSRYYNNSHVYSFNNTKTKQDVSKTVKQAVDEALAKLSDIQLNDGDYSSWGTVNVESTAQVLVALTELGIDPMKDTRFIKNGHTLLDGILKYRLSDGAFCHSFQADPGNPSAQAGKYNYMATDQACYALVSYWRQINGLNALYNLRADKKASVSETTAPTTKPAQATNPQTTKPSETTIQSVQTSGVSESTGITETTTESVSEINEASCTVSSDFTDTQTSLFDTNESAYISDGNNKIAEFIDAVIMYYLKWIIISLCIITVSVVSVVFIIKKKKH